MQSQALRNERVTGLVHPSINFVWDKTNLIWDAWAKEDNEVKAIKFAIILSLFVAKPIKQKMKKLVRQIVAEMTEAAKMDGVNFLPEEYMRSQRVKAVAIKWLPILIDKMTDLFDERGYYEIRRPPVPVGEVVPP